MHSAVRTAAPTEHMPVAKADVLDDMIYQRTPLLP